jgi:monovalent cation:proton antiporter-2 (CPA2) family protein
MAVENAADPILADAAIYLSAAVLSVPLFKTLGLGSVLGYLIAGALIGPAGFGLISEAEDVLHVAEFGVVLLLFVLGLELQPSRLWRMRMEIFGAGGLQMGVSALLIGGALWAFGFGVSAAVVVGLALALSSTAFAVQILRERREFGTPFGRRAFAILLFQDIMVAPLLVLVSFLAPFGAEAEGGLWQFAQMAGALAVLVLVGRYGLPWAFRLLARLGADEVFTAAALLVVGASALLMQWAGLSMALGAFLAGVLLAETEFRHQLETDIEPFRSLFLGLFFIAVGMAVDWGVVSAQLLLVLAAALALFAVKAGVLYLLARQRGAPNHEAVKLGAVLGQSGEFAFVLLALASESWIITAEAAALLTAIVGVSMALTPFAVKAADAWARRRGEGEEDDLETVMEADRAPVIVAGFGRSGQIIARIMRMRGYDLTLIDNSPTRIRIAESFGDKVFFGDGSRLDVLAMAGAAEARAIFLCINDREGANKAVGALRERFPDTLILAMTYDRFSDIEMRAAGADVSIREVFESSVLLARRGLERMGDNSDLDSLISEFRRRDEELLRLQIEHGLRDGIRKMREKYSIEKVV